MTSKKTGRLLALFAMASLIAPHGTSAQSDAGAANLASVPADQAAAYELAVSQGTAALTEFMDRFPTSALVPSVMTALASQVGIQAAIQAALDAGVPTETVFGVASSIAAPTTTVTAQASPAGSQSPY